MAALVAASATIAPLTSSLRVSARPVEKLSLNKAFGLKNVESRTRMMASYSVTLKLPDNVTKVITCDDDTFILDAAEEAGVDLPFSCRSGACSSCAGKVEGGSVDQSEQNFLDDEQVDAGWVLTCVAKPKSDCTVSTHQEDAMNG